MFDDDYRPAAEAAPRVVTLHCLDIRGLMGMDLEAHHLAKVPLRYCLLADRRRGDDGLLALATGILLSDRLDLSNDSDLIFDPQGKPYVLGRDFKISIAHAGYLAVVARSEGPVGVDVEPIPSYTDQVHVQALEGIYGKGKVERKAILSTKQGPENFCRMWTHAEAACKRDGIDLKSALRADREFLEHAPGASVEVKGHLVSVVADGPVELEVEVLELADWLARS